MASRYLRNSRGGREVERGRLETDELLRADNIFLPKEPNMRKAAMV
jgi:hypothetical protein